MKGKLSLVMVMVLILALFGLTGCSKDEMATKVDDRLTVETVAAAAGSITKEVSYSGSLQGANEVTLYPKVAARVVAIYKQEGNRVSKGQTIVSLDSSDYQAALVSAQAALTMAQSNYQNAQNNAQRTRALFDQGGVSTQQMEQADLGVLQADSAVKQSQAAVQNAQNMLNNCRITSPINGVVGLIKVSVGNMVSPAAAVAVVSSPGQMSVKVDVSEAEIAFVSLNSPVKVRVSSVGDQDFPGKVTSVATVVDPMSKGFPVEITIDNPANTLKSGMLAEIQLSTEKKDGVLRVPRAAVVENGARRVVFVVDAKSVVHETDIEVGLENRDWVEVISGIKPGDQIVIKGQTLLHDADEVRLPGGKS